MATALRSLTFFLITISFHFATASEFTLVDKEQGAAPIIIPAGLPPRTKDAAVTLADYIGKISGQRPEIVESTNASFPARAIFVAPQPNLERMFPGIDFSLQHPEETLIAATEHHLFIGGRDRWNPDYTEEKGRLAMRTGIQQEYGTANAVYTFIRDHLDVRWLWPGEADFTPRSKISIAPCDIRYHPQFRARAGMFQRLSLGNNKEGIDELWARFQRVQLDSMELSGSHGFGEWWDKYGKNHIEYFAAGPDGTRRPIKANPKNTKLCASNPAVWKQWLSDVEKQLATNPVLRVINVSPNDGYVTGHCVCENCLAWDHPDGQKVEWGFGKGIKHQGVVQSDRDVRFANTLGRMLKQRFPDRELYLQLHAYGLARNAPIGVAPDDNVVITSVANFHMRSPEARKEPMSQHNAWAGKTKNLMWRPNLGSQAGLRWGMPDVAMTQAGEDFRFVADRNGTGLFFDMHWFHWSTQGPQYYALAHLAWNPYIDVETLMDEYYRRAYGPAADEMKTYWQLMEQTRMEFVAEEPSRQRAFDIPKKYTAEWLAKANTILDSAKAKLSGAEPKYRRRFQFTSSGLDFVALVIDTRKRMQHFEASRGTTTEEAARESVLENWEKAEKMQAEMPEFAINWVTLFKPPKPGKKPSKTIIGLHPDAPLEGRTLRELRAVGLE